MQYVVLDIKILIYIKYQIIRCIRNINCRIANIGELVSVVDISVTFLYGSASTDPYLWLTDPDSDPAVFVSDLHDANSKFFYAYYLPTS